MYQTTALTIVTKLCGVTTHKLGFGGSSCSQTIQAPLVELCICLHRCGAVSLSQRTLPVADHMLHERFLNLDTHIIIFPDAGIRAMRSCTAVLAHYACLFLVEHRSLQC